MGVSWSPDRMQISVDYELSGVQHVLARGSRIVTWFLVFGFQLESPRYAGYNRKTLVEIASGLHVRQ